MRKQACNSKLRHSLTILQQVRTIGAIEGFNDMEKASLLVVCSGENPAVESVLAQSGYRVNLTSTPEDTMLSVLEREPQIVIWSESLDQSTEWQRIRTILESRKPFLQLSKGWKVEDDESSNPTEGDELILSEEAPIISANALIRRLEALESSQLGSQHFYTKVGNKLRRIQLSDIRFIQVEGKYSAIQLETRQYHVKASLKDLLHILNSEEFVRVSRNFVVNLNHIDHIDVYQSTVHIGGEDVPVSRTYKENLMKNVRLL